VEKDALEPPELQTRVVVVVDKVVGMEDQQLVDLELLSFVCGYHQVQPQRHHQLQHNCLIFIFY
jgi:hypothetical protein